VLPHIIQLLVQDTNDDEVYRCESCGLILYSLEPVAPHNLDADSGTAASALTS
jgi:hypothetical protein